MPLQMQLVQRLQLAPPQKDLLARAKAAKERLKIPYTDVKEAPNIALFRERLGVRVQEVGSTLLDIPLSAEVMARPHFFDLTKIFLTLQAGWKSENDKGIHLLKRGYQHYVERGDIKRLKYGGTTQIELQLKVAEALVNDPVYLEAWQNDIESDSFWTTDELYDWLTMGKVCGGSCQRYDGVPYWNKSLGGPIFSLDKLAFTGENKSKQSRTLLMPTPVKVGDQVEWDLLLPAVYIPQIDHKDKNDPKFAKMIQTILVGALKAAGQSGSNRVGVLSECFSRFSMVSLAEAFEGILGQEIIVEIKNRDGALVRKERIIPTGIKREDCTILAMEGPNQYKYWDNVGGLIDYKEAKKVEIAGIEVPAVKIKTSADFISFERNN